MFQKMSLAAKLSIPPILLCLVAGAIGWVGYVSIERETKSFLRVSEEALPNIRMSNQMFLHFRMIRISLRSLGLPGITKEQADASIRDGLAALKSYEEVVAKYEALTFVEGEAEIYDRVKSSFARFKAVGERVLALQASGTEEDRKKMLEIFFKDCPEAAAVFSATIRELVAFHQKNADGWVGEATETARAAKSMILWSLAVGLGIGALLAFLSTRSASRLVASISRVVASLSTGADHVAQVATDVSRTSEVLSSSSVQQAAAIQETTAAVEETRAMVAKNSENARHSREIAERSQSTATRGKASVNEVISAIREIADSSGDIAKQIDDSNREMGEIVKVIQEIGTKTKVINDIVFQTKLLSFNASVEAARAGEQGKGFAVVAEEVGNLAQMSGNSAKEIGDLLESSTQRVSEIVAATKTKVERLVANSQEKVRTGTEIAERCAEVLAEIVGDVSQVGGLVTEISSASEEQTNGMNEVNKAVVELDNAAQQNSAASNQAAQGAESLMNQVGELRGLIGELNALVGNRSEAGGSAAPAGEPAPVVELHPKGEKAPRSLSA